MVFLPASKSATLRVKSKPQPTARLLSLKLRPALWLVDLPVELFRLLALPALFWLLLVLSSDDDSRAELHVAKQAPAQRGRDGQGALFDRVGIDLAGPLTLQSKGRDRLARDRCVGVDERVPVNDLGAER